MRGPRKESKSVLRRPTRIAQFFRIVFLSARLRLLFGLADLSLFAFAHLSSVADLALAAFGFDKFRRRLAIVAICRLVAFAFVLGRGTHVGLLRNSAVGLTTSSLRRGSGYACNLFHRQNLCERHLCIGSWLRSSF